MVVATEDIRGATRKLQLAGHPVCVHASLRSFGKLTGGAASVIDGLRLEGCTVLVPTFSDAFRIPPPPGQRPARNGWDYRDLPEPSSRVEPCYSPATTQIDRDMGALAAEVVGRPERCRGDHPLNSFSAIGPLADRLVSRQRPLDVYGPLKELAEADGSIVLMGVGLEKMTLIHLAEAMAGRQLFRRWANGHDGSPMMCRTGGCSEGFNNLAPSIAAATVTGQVGTSCWRVFSVRRALPILVGQIRSRPEVTQCGHPDCGRCQDAIQGGPILTDGMH